MLAIVMFLNGLAVMVLEMVGARLLAPELGTSTIVWTSLIGVILASLSMGYWFGGKLADRFLAGEDAASYSQPEREGEAKRAPSKARSGSDTAPGKQQRKKAFAVLAGILLVAAIFVLLTALIHAPILHILSRTRASLHLLTICAAVLLFAVPAVLCGMVSPYAMRLAITDSSTSGATIGRLNAISTVGSIVGTFLGGFVLLSWFGSREITLAVAGCLLLAAALVKARPVTPKAIVALLIIGLAVSTRLSSISMAEEGRYITMETPYSSLRIFSQDRFGRPVRLLMTDPGSCQSGAFVDDPAELVFDYTKFYALGPFMNPSASRILMLGGGGYSIPKWLLAGRSALTSDAFQLDVVELDPGMTRAAERYFDLLVDDARMKIYHEDARRFLNNAAAAEQEERSEYGPYQLIFSDCFNSYYTVPFHMGTVEAAEKIHTLLAEDGMFIMNIISAVEGDNGRLLRSIYRAFDTVFDDIRLFAVRSRYHGEEIQNVMLVAFRSAGTLPSEHDTSLPEEIAALLRKEWKQPLENDLAACPALRDNYAPVERYTLNFVR